MKIKRGRERRRLNKEKLKNERGQETRERKTDGEGKKQKKLDEKYMQIDG